MEKITLSVSEAANLLGISRPTMYQLMAREDFPCLNVGTRRLIYAEGLHQWVAAQAKCPPDRGSRESKTNG